MFFLYHKKSFRTGRVLGKALGVPRGKEPKGAGDLIRWGNAIAFPGRTIIQPADGIARAGNKLVALRAMQAAGVRVPEFGNAPGEGVWFGRKTHGFGGKDIRVVEDRRRNLYGEVDFYTKHIPNKREYRIHVYRGRVIRLQRKYLDFPEQNTNEYVKNAAQGYRFRTPQRQLNAERTDMAIKAVEALGLHFGAVDLVVGEDNLSYVLEVNTAPRCSPLTGRMYVDAMVEHLRELGYDPRPRYEELEALPRQSNDT